VPLIVGGGIRNGAVARETVTSGADIIVTGTLVEEDVEVRERIYDIVTNIKSIRR
jgi:phosphoglycerol geranylgeranyltransferase